MKKILSVILTAIMILSLSVSVFAAETVEDTITLSDFIDVKKEQAKSVQIYICGNNYEINTDKFFEIADECIIIPCSDPQPMTKDGMYIGITSGEAASYVYISNEGGIDRAVPASGRQLNAVYTMDTVSYFDRIIEIVPEISLSGLEMFDKETVERVKLYYPGTGTEAGYDGEASIEGFFTAADKIMLKVNSNPYEISKNGLYVTVCDKTGNEGYIYITESGEIDYYSVYDTENANPRATYITENIDEIKAFFESVRPRTYTTNAVLNHISDWARDSVLKASEKSIVESEKNYNYTQPITREDFCELVFNLICAVNRSFTTDDREVKFTDTFNHKVQALNRADIIYGKSETKFAPDDFLTREEAATILVRMINREMPMAATEMWFEFDDINDISDWASDSVQTMCNLGFMIGVGENKFAPKNTYTAEQAVVTLVRIYEATRKTYNYETPLGVVRTEENYNSHINFAVKCDAKVELIQDRNDFNETHYMIEKPVKALTDQTSHMLISFDDFAEIFNGEWKLNEGIFEFTYDTSYEVKLSKFEKYESETDREWPNKTEAVNVITFSGDMSIIRVNGNDMEIKAQYGGKVFNGYIVMYEGNLYIPVQMVAELLKFDIAALQAIY